VLSYFHKFDFRESRQVWLSLFDCLRAAVAVKKIFVGMEPTRAFVVAAGGSATAIAGKVSAERFVVVKGKTWLRLFIVRKDFNAKASAAEKSQVRKVKFFEHVPHLLDSLRATNESD
jgi:hypothetical protein